ncbi:hypothetical protein [Delftia tsuruhatensis]|uniref:hypothetical protein n=1 Tax=Delftia tsuruhatensis TaxID=180282 RepID=UPI0007748528|nr:hypothetical protein [Delftia tsuruhatensis]SFB61571.1 hypothetical protein SAMN05444579_11397 [Delftia tsuruhatensis]
MTHILIPREPSTALLRPFIGCNTQELHEAWAAMVRIAEVQHARSGSQCLQQIEEPTTLAGTTIEQYARMFDAACEALGQVSDCLGINSDINPGAEPIIAAIEQLRAGKTHPVLDDRWKARILDGRAIERDEMGLGDHPELPLLDEGMMPRSFFAALGLELAHTSAEDQLDGEVLGAMSEAVNWTDWLPTPPHGDGWKLVSIFDTEDGPVAWWLRELPEAEDGTTTIRNLQAEVEKLEARIARISRAGASPAAVAHLPAVLEQIAQGWDGCKYDAPGETLDIGADIRAAAKRLLAEQPAAMAGPTWGEQQVHALAIHMAASAPPSHKPRDYDADMAWAHSALGFIAGHAPAAPALEAPAAPAEVEKLDAAAMPAQLSAIAAQAALDAKERHSYLPNTSAEAATWRPHFWVIQAMRAAIKFDRALHRAAAPQSPAGFQSAPVAWASCQTLAALEQHRQVNNFPAGGMVLATQAGNATEPLYTAPQAPAALDELRQIADIAACWGCDHPDAPDDTELLRRVKWAARQLRAVSQAPAAPILGDAERLAAARQDKSLAGYWRNRVAGLAEEFTTAEAALYLADRIVADLYNLPQAGVARPAAPAAPAVDAWLQPDDMEALQRFHETAEDDESYDIGKEAVARLCAFGCLQSHSFGRYSTTDFGDYLLDTWAGARTLPFTTAAERRDRAAQATTKGATNHG